jgi:hypothetical protein
MARPTFFNVGQDFPNENVPVAFNYLEVGGYGDSAAPGQFFPFLADVDGNIFVTLGGAGTGPILLADNADGVAEVAAASRVPTVARLYGYDQAAGEYDRLRTDDDSAETSDADGDPNLRVMNRPRLYNNNDNNWQRQKGQGTATILASASRTVETTSANLLNTNWKTAHYIVDVTVIPSGDITVNIEAFDVASSVWYPILIALPIAATGTTVLKVGVGFAPIANLTANNMIPYITRVRVEVADASAITYSVGANFGI